jgi:predicted dehydrogenase
MPDTREQLRIGFLGAGLIATYHSKSLRHGGAPVVRAGVYDPDTDRAAAFAAASGHHVCRSAEEVIAGADAVYVCTWTSEHLPLVELAVTAGKPVFCEKPLSTSLEAATRLAHLVTAAGVVNQVGLVLRHSPAFLALKRLIDDPASGRLLTVVFRDDQFIPVQGHYSSTWRGDHTKSGAGTLIEHSIHDIDMLEFLGGPIATISARTRYNHEISGIEDVAAVSFDYASRADGSSGLGTLTSVWHDVLGRPSLRRVEVFCERAWAALGDDWFGPVEWTREGFGSGTWERDELLAGAEADLLAQGRHTNPDVDFVLNVLAGTSSHPDVNVALRAHVVCDAMYRSAAAAGATVAIPAGIP